VFRPRFTFAVAVFLASAVGPACASRAPAKGPRETLDAYARALEAGRTEEAYDLLSDEAKKSIPFEAFSRMVKENPEEVKDIATALSRPSGPPLVTATVTAPNGESLLLVYEDGEWRVDGSTIDLYSQATPKAAVVSFIRAYENRRYDVLLRFVPDKERAPEGGPALDSTKLRRAFEGEQKDEMEQITQGLRAALPTAKIELLGDRATMAYGAGSTVELVREHGLWKIEEFK
jgi:hypothetical protein